MQSPTSHAERVIIENEPKRVEQTSPATLPELENMLITRYPMARAPAESIAIAASPLTFPFCPVFKRRIAQRTVMGRTINILFVMFITVAIAKAPKATCERPSPIKENLLSTRTTPKSAEQSAISTPTMRANQTN